MKIDNQRRATLKIVETEGYGKGRQDEKIEMVKKMKAKGMDVAFISEMSGLSVEEIEKLGY